MTFQLLRAGLALLALFPLFTSADDLENYRLTDNALGKFEKATEAMYQFARENPQLAKKLDNDDESDDVEGNVEEMVRELDRKAPGLRTRIESSGMELEEYFTFSMVLAANAFGVAMADHFGKQDDAALTDVQRANIAFFRRNQQRFEQFNTRMQTEYADVMNKDSNEEDEYSEEEFYEDEETYDEQTQ